MNPKALASFAVLTLLFGIVSGVAFADDKADIKTKETRPSQSKSSASNSDQKNCTNDLESIKKLLDDASRKASALKEKLYSEWQSQYSSGQTKDDWNVYAKKLESSQEMQEFRQLQEKYNLISSTCQSNPAPATSSESKVQFTQSDECVNAQKMINDIDQKYSTLKQNAYNDWKSQNAAGTYPGTWEQYADEKLIKSTDVLDLAKMREKYEPFLRTCYVQSNGMTTDTSQTKPLPTTEKPPVSTATSKTKPLPPVPAKTDQKQSAKTDDSAKKQDKSYAKFTKAKQDKIIKKPKRQLVQK